MKFAGKRLSLIATLFCLTTIATAQTPPDEKTAVVYGENIRYLEAGQGPAVILLHGLGGVKEIWMANLAPLAAKYHIYAIDQIGFGRSDKPLLDFKIATFVDFLAGFMQTQNLSKATLVGNSLGGWVALDFAVRHPTMIDKLVLVDSAGFPWSSAPKAPLNPATLAEMRAVLEAIFYNKQFVTDQFVEQAFTNHVHNNDGYTIQRTIAGMVTENQYEDQKLGSIHAPILIVWGGNDELIPASVGDKIHDGMPGSKLVVYDQCGHFPEVEKAADFNRDVLDFLGK